jgi:hypothetical protein
MQVGIGSISVDDDTRKAIRREMGQSGLASRADVKAYVEEKLKVVFANAGAPAEEPADESLGSGEREADPAPEVPQTAPPAADELPNPPSAGTATSTTPGAGTF